MWGKRILGAWPYTVVVDSEEVLVLYLARGTQFKRRSTYPGTHLPVGEWEIVDDVWRNDHLRINSRGDEPAYLAIWSGHRFRNWYVNIENSERTPLGLDFIDHILDVRIWPDLAGWEWKDEKELAEAVELGLVTQTQAHSYYAEGRRAIERLEARRSPFDGRWETWKPDPTWRVPQLPPNWQTGQ